MDVRGPRFIIEFGALTTTAGLLGATQIASPFTLYLTLGLLVGIGVNCMTYSVHSQFLPNWFVRRRALAIGIAAAIPALPRVAAAEQKICYADLQRALEETGGNLEKAMDNIRQSGLAKADKKSGRVAQQGLVEPYIHGGGRIASLVEINPLNCDSKGNIIALDAKFNFDSNALFRHPEIVAYRDLDEEDPAEVEASKFDLAYISLDGNIGCLVNGAGLAMATMDTIKLFGGEPANFLDVGGGATTEKVTEAFKIMLRNPKVKAILVNIFGGIMRCDVIAEGVISASKAVGLKVPLVVRMKGTNEDLGKKMLAESGLPIISKDTMADAARAVVEAAGK